jgi:small subunit ribosomal protein S20
MQTLKTLKSFDSGKKLGQNCASISLMNRIGVTNLANIKSAKKRAIQSEKRRLVNQSQKTEMRTYVKKALQAIASGDVVAAEAAYREAASKLDTMAGRGIIHKNKAARHKSRLSARVKTLTPAA